MHHLPVLCHVALSSLYAGPAGCLITDHGAVPGNRSADAKANAAAVQVRRKTSEEVHHSIVNPVEIVPIRRRTRTRHAPTYTRRRTRHPQTHARTHPSTHADADVHADADADADAYFLHYFKSTGPVLHRASALASKM